MGDSFILWGPRSHEGNPSPASTFCRLYVEDSLVYDNFFRESLSGLLGSADQEYGVDPNSAAKTD
jgi:hypothetical protein